jgi:trk system potassium uptake protein TrkH
MAWILAAFIGCLPFYLSERLDFLDSFFESMSGFTTTGITMFTGLNTLEPWLLFWRCLSQWFGGLGIISFFMITRFGSNKGSHRILSAENHKISSDRPVPGLTNTLKFIWTVYIFFTCLLFLLFILGQMPVFESVCHSLSTISTGGFSVWDDNINHYRLSGNPFFRYYEYVVIFGMLAGGISFFVHYRLFSGKISSLWQGMEIKYWWYFIILFTLFTSLDHAAVFKTPLEETFRTSLFQCTSVISTAGFSTKPIHTGWYPEMSKFIFLLLMFTGGCAGSTSGGFKIFRLIILNRTIWFELFRLRVPKQAVKRVVIEKKAVLKDELISLSALFYAWIFLVFTGTLITCIFTNFTPFQSLSGMFSCLSNIGPSFIPPRELIEMHWIVKIIYLLSMLAGRLEIFPFLLVFSSKAWK